MSVDLRATGFCIYHVLCNQIRIYRLMSLHLIMAGEASGDSQGRRQQECAVKLEKLSSTFSLGTDNRSHHLAAIPLLGTQAAGK